MRRRCAVDATLCVCGTGGGGPVVARRSLIDRIFAAATIEDILHGLDDEGANSTSDAAFAQRDRGDIACANAPREPAASRLNRCGAGGISASMTACAWNTAWSPRMVWEPGSLRGHPRRDHRQGPDTELAAHALCAITAADVERYFATAAAGASAAMSDPTATSQPHTLEPVHADDDVHRAMSWGERLVLFLRVMAAVSMVKGLYHWAIVLGVGADAHGGFEIIRPPIRRRRRSSR